MTFIAYVRIMLAGLCFIGFALQAHGAAGSDGSQVLESFEIPTDGYPLIVPVKIKGKTYRFSIGTASSGMVFDRKLKHLLGEEIRAISVNTQNKGARLALYKAPDATIGRLRAVLPPPHPSSQMACADLSVYRLGSADNVEGLLGVTFLKDYVVRIDFDKGKLQFLTAVGEEPGQPLPLTFERNMTHTRARLADDIEASFVLSTELCGLSGILGTELASELRKRGLLTYHSESLVGDIRGPEPSGLYELASLRLSVFDHRKLLFGTGSGNGLALAYLVRYIVTFDFPNATVYLKPSRHFARAESDPPPGTRTWGVELSCLSGDIAVLEVVKDSPAARAGVRVSDVLLAVDGTDVTVPLEFSVHRLFCTDSKSLRLTLKRREGTRDITLRLPIAGAAKRDRAK